MYQGNLIVLLDQKETDDGRSRSRIFAFDVSSGRTVWETLRPTRDSWTSPIIINAAGRKQIITSSMPWVIAYDAGSGAEIWRVNCLHGDITPSPIYAGGLVFAVMELAELTAINPGGSGDVSATHVVWKTNGDFPSVCSPVSNGSLLFLVTSAGLMTCWDITARKMVWEQDLEVSVVSSPTLVGEQVYVIGEGGEGIVLKASAEYTEVARSQLGEPCQASPAFVDGRIYIRGESHLFCIGEK
jgi:outer membrane protein assembly factor BamB